MFEHYTFGMQARPPVRRRSRELSPGEVPPAVPGQQCGQSQFRSQCPSPPLSATAVSPPPTSSTRIPDCTPAPDSIDSLARELSRQNLQLDRKNLEQLQLQLSSPSASPSIPCMSPIPPCPELEIDDEPPRPGLDSRRGRRDIAVPPPSPMDVDQTPVVVADKKRLSRQRSGQFKQHSSSSQSQSQAVQRLVEGMIAARSQCNVRGPSPPLLTPTSAARLGPVLEPDHQHQRIELDDDCVGLQVDDAYANGGSGGSPQNYWWGCLKVSEECTHCYAETFSKRVGKDIWGPAANTDRWILGEKNWQNPYKWNKLAQKENRIHRVFCSSMSDLYEDHPQVTQTRNRFFREVIPATPWLAWQFLTKRPENILTMSPASWQQNWPANVWVGTSVGKQARAVERIPELLKVPATVRFLSCEPLLERIDITPWLPELQWIICGGESGPRHRAFNPDWARSLKDQCQDASVPYWFKQHGGLHHDSGGCLLDGKEWKEYPKVA